MLQPLVSNRNRAWKTNGSDLPFLECFILLFSEETIQHSKTLAYNLPGCVCSAEEHDRKLNDDIMPERGKNNTGSRS